MTDMMESNPGQSKMGLTLEKEAWLAIVTILKTAYPTKGFLDSDAAVELWYKMLQDIPMQKVQNAAARYIMEEHFPPTIADIRKRCAEDNAAQLPDWEQGWAEWLTVMHKYGYMREDEAIESLSPITKEVVKCLGWKNLCHSQNLEGDRIAFREVHGRYVQQARENLQLPELLRVHHYQIPTYAEERLQIEAIQNGMRYIGTDQRTEGYAEVAASRIRERLEYGQYEGGVNSGKY
nr:MAG TPA: replisome organizer [Caudoviricetes sp.]